MDEAQNLTPHEVKTIITRCGEGTKIVLTGDPYQIDNPYVDAATNGLTVSADRLRGESLVAHVLLNEVVAQAFCMHGQHMPITDGGRRVR